MATNLHPQPALHDPLDSGTPVINYVGPAAVVPLPNPTPAPAVQPATRPTNRALSWAKRIHFALLGAIIGLFLYGSMSGLLGAIILLIVWVVGIGIAEERSRFAQWGFVTSISTLLIPITMGFGITNYFDFINLTNWLRISGFAPDLDILNKGIGYLVIATGLALLACFAVIKSLRRWRAAIGLLIIVATITGGLLSNYGYGVPSYPGSTEQPLIDTLSNMGNILNVLAPTLMIALYILSRHSQQPNTPPDVKSEG